MFLGALILFEKSILRFMNNCLELHGIQAGISPLFIEQFFMGAFFGYSPIVNNYYFISVLDSA